MASHCSIFVLILSCTAKIWCWTEKGSGFQGLASSMSFIFTPDWYLRFNISFKFLLHYFTLLYTLLTIYILHITLDIHCSIDILPVPFSWPKPSFQLNFLKTFIPTASLHAGDHLYYPKYQVLSFSFAFLKRLHNFWKIHYAILLLLLHQTLIAFHFQWIILYLQHHHINSLSIVFADCSRLHFTLSNRIFYT